MGLLAKNGSRAADHAKTRPLCASDQKYEARRVGVRGETYAYLCLPRKGHVFYQPQL